MTEEFLTAGEVAKVLGWSKRTVLNYMSGEKMPGVQVTMKGRWEKRMWRVPKSELVRWMNEKGLRQGVDYVW